MSCSRCLLVIIAGPGSDLDRRRRGPGALKSDSAPMHIGSTPWYIRGFMRHLPGRSRKGRDHPQPPISAPRAPDIGRGAIFWSEASRPLRSRRMCSTWAARSRHQRGRVRRVRGGEIYDGLRWYRAGELNGSDRMVFDNVYRDDEPRRHERDDGGCQAGRDRMLRLFQRYGETVMSAAYSCWMDPTERFASRSAAAGRRVRGAGWLATTPAAAVSGCVETKVIVEGARSIGSPAQTRRCRRGSTSHVRFAARGGLLRGAHDPNDEVTFRNVPQRRRLPASEGVAPQGTIYNPTFRVCSRALPVQRVVDNTILAGGCAAGGVTAGNPPGSLLRVLASPRDGRVLALPRSERGRVRRPLRQGRDGLIDNLMANTRNNDRGARPPLPDPLRSVRAPAGAGRAGPVARRHRDHPPQSLPRRRRLLVRRRPSDRPAARHLRRLGRPRGVVPEEPGYPARGGSAREGDRHPVCGRRVHRVS